MSSAVAMSRARSQGSSEGNGLDDVMRIEEEKRKARTKNQYCILMHAQELSADHGGGGASRDEG